jgi:hypothetical protein
MSFAGKSPLANTYPEEAPQADGLLSSLEKRSVGAMERDE